MTGSAAACLASRASNAVAVSVWDKGGGAGGRMSTTRGAKDGTVTADLGAQYFTSNEDSRTRHQVHKWPKEMSFMPCSKLENISIPLLYLMQVLGGNIIHPIRNTLHIRWKIYFIYSHPRKCTRS